MLNIAGGIILAIVILALVGMLVVFFIEAAPVILSLIAFIAILTYIFYHPTLLLFMVLIGGLILIFSISKKKSKLGEQTEQEKMVESRALSPLDLSHRQNNKSQYMNTSSTEAFLIAQLERFQAIGGFRLWLRDRYKMVFPAFTIKQKIQKARYIEIERQKLQNEAFLLKTSKTEMEQEFKKSQELKRLISLREQKEKEVSDIKIYQITLNKEIQLKLFSVIKELERNFAKHNSIIFEVGEDRSNIHIIRNGEKICSYTVSAEARISMKTSISISYNLQEQGGNNIASENDLEKFKKLLKQKLISDVARA